MAWSEVVEPQQQKNNKRKNMVERYGCAQKQELREIFGTIFDRQLNSNKQKDLHIRIVFETNPMEESSSSSMASTSKTSTVDRSIGGTAGATPIPQSPNSALTPVKKSQI